MTTNNVMSLKRQIEILESDVEAKNKQIAALRAQVDGAIMQADRLATKAERAIANEKAIRKRYEDACGELGKLEGEAAAWIPARDELIKRARYALRNTMRAAVVMYAGDLLELLGCDLETEEDEE